MITLITGLPGAGKTLYALNFVKNLSEKDNRPVYYSGINDIKLPWFELEKGEDWHSVPTGSIVLIDECQRVFRPRGNGSAVPVHVSKLETHRHDGIDLVVITQHPMLADSNLRRLVGQHFHVVRAFGTKKATVHEFQEVKTDCDKNRSGSVRHDFFYPKDSFNWYKSAELHTHKARIPARVFFILGLPLLLAALVYLAYSFWRIPGTGNTLETKSPTTAISPSAAIQAPKFKSAAQFLDERVPRVAGLAYTAPIYDEVTRPVDAPFPAACISSLEKCTCFSQQATILDIPEPVCKQIVARGYFKDWEGKASIQNSQREALTTERIAPKALEAIDLPLVIAAPPPLRLSDGFSAPAPSPTDNSSHKSPQTPPKAPQSPFPS